MNNHGSALTDIFVFMIMALVITIGVGVSAYVFFTMDPIMEEAFSKVNTDTEGWNGSEVYGHSIQPAISSIDVLKWGVVAVFVAMALSILLGSFLINFSPIFFIAYLIISLIASIISFPLSNLYESIYLDATLNSTLTGFWGMNYIMLNLPYWVIAIMSIAGILMFVNYIRRDSGDSFSGGGGSIW